MSEKVQTPSKAEQLLTKIFGKPIQHFVSQEPTESEVVQLCTFELGAYKTNHEIKQMQREDKNKVYSHVANTLLSHYSSQSQPDDNLKDHKGVARAVSELMKRVEKLKSDVKHMDNKSYITAKQHDFAGIFEVKKDNSRIPITESIEFEETPMDVDSPLEEDKNCEHSDSDSDWIDDDEEEEECEPKSNRNFYEYPEFISMAMRYKLSNRAISNIYNALLVDMGVKEENRYLTPSKVRRLRIKYGRKRAEKHLQTKKNLEVLAYDGKKSAVALPHSQTVVEEKIVVVDGADADHGYLHHFIANPGTGFSVGYSLFKTAEMYQSIDTVKALKTDGPPVVTGPHNGSNRTFENLSGKPVQWIVCLFHMNELVLKKVFVTIDGPTGSGEVYTGDIGRKISGNKNRGLGRITRDMVVDFERIIPKEPCHFEPEHLQNSDMKNFNTMMKVIIGLLEIGDDFVLVPGPVNQARWVTTATNLMCLFVITENPPANLVLLVTFIINVYGPTICDIKKNWHVSCGPINFFNCLKRCRMMFQDHPKLWNECMITLQTNGFMCHIENVVLAMACDDNPDVRQQAVDIIENVRQKKQKSRSKRVRKFIVPNIDFDAETYYTMIDFSKLKPVMNYVSPPLLDSYTIDDIKKMDFSDNFKHITCHQQHVERWVANTSSASKYAIGQDMRHQHLLNFMDSTRKVSTEPTKRQFLDILKDEEHENGSSKVKRKLFTDKST